jgi:peptide/nickel transport system ATP-binding protein
MSDGLALSANDSMPGLGTASPVAGPKPPSGGAGRISLRGRSPGARLGRVGAGLLLVLIVVATLAPLVARHSPSRASGPPFAHPTLSHPLGTDDLGADIFSQLVYGTRVSLVIGLGSAVFAVGVGLAIAIVAGYFRGWVGAALMRAVDVALTFPVLPLALVLAAFLGRSLSTTILVLAVVLWARPARVLRSQVLRVRQADHVVAAEAMGVPLPRILVRHVLSRVAPLAASQFISAANFAILLEAALGFLGLGNSTTITWGTMLYYANARNALLTGAWVWWILPAGLALTATVVGLAFVGYAIEERTDRRLSARAPRFGFGQRRPAAAAPSPDSEETLRIEHYAVTYQIGQEIVPAVHDVDLVVRRGRITGLVGESGSGKSTLALGVMGLLPPEARAQGTILFAGARLGPGGIPPARLRGRQIGYVPQAAQSALNPAYRVHRQVTEAAALTRDRAEAEMRATELLALVGIPADRHHAYPHEYSGGMRQRAVMAMALVNEPPLVVADEPTTGLDVLNQASIVHLLLDLKTRFGLTILLISHDLHLVSRVADDLHVIHRGAIVETGAASEVLTAPRDPYTRQLLGSLAALAPVATP